MTKTVLMTGGSSYLGQYLAPKAAERFNLFTTYHTQAREVRAGRPVALDLTRRDDIFRVISDLKPQAIIHAAALNPGSGDAAAMMQVNGQGSRAVAEAAVEVGARLIYISTDVVHDGRNAPYDDDAEPTPLNDYGRSKAAAEAAILEVDPQAAVVRTSLIYGLTIMDRGTAGFVEKLQSGRPLVLFNDVIRQPIWVETLAEALLKLVNIPFGGRLNLVGRQPLTREAFGRRMLDWWQVETGELLRSGRAADISAAIPLDLRMSVERAEELLKMSFPGVDEVLASQRE